MLEPAAHVLIFHGAGHYPQWKAVFDDAASLRKGAGKIEYRLLHYEADDRRVVHSSAAGAG